MKTTRKPKAIGHAPPLTQSRFWRICNAIFGWPARPPSPEEKQIIVSSTARSRGIRNFVETGTYLGDMVAAQIGNFDKIVTIELSDNLYEAALSRFIGYANVQVVHGDSARVLSDILQDLKGPILYWLDAHYSGSVTSGGEVDAPVLKELSTIAARLEPRDVILIDDARLFGWRPGYPSLSRIRNFISQHAPHYEMQIISDIIHILPRAKSSGS